MLPHQVLPRQVLPHQVLPHQVIPSVQAVSCSSSQAETKDFNEDRATDPRFKLSSNSSSLVVSSTTIGRKEHQRVRGEKKKETAVSVPGSDFGKHHWTLVLGQEQCQLLAFLFHSSGVCNIHHLDGWPEFPPPPQQSIV